MATETERPKAWLPGRKRNPAYDAWKRAKKAKESTDYTVEGGGKLTEAAINSVIASVLPNSEILTLRVIGPAKNSNFMLCDHDGEKVAVRIGKRYANRVLGKSIPVRREDDGTYTHAP